MNYVAFKAALNTLDDRMILKYLPEKSREKTRKIVLPKRRYAKALISVAIIAAAAILLVYVLQLAHVSDDPMTTVENELTTESSDRSVPLGEQITLGVGEKPLDSSQLSIGLPPFRIAPQFNTVYAGKTISIDLYLGQCVYNYKSYKEEIVEKPLRKYVNYDLGLPALWISQTGEVIFDTYQQSGDTTITGSLPVMINHGSEEYFKRFSKEEALSSESVEAYAKDLNDYPLKEEVFLDFSDCEIGRAYVVSFQYGFQFNDLKSFPGYNAAMDELGAYGKYYITYGLKFSLYFYVGEQGVGVYYGAREAKEQYEKYEPELSEHALTNEVTELLQERLNTCGFDSLYISLNSQSNKQVLLSETNRYVFDIYTTALNGARSAPAVCWSAPSV